MDGNAKSISLQGIVHNETKIGVQDGMCEDLVNLRFKDGSWRPSGNGLPISLQASANGFTQFFIHTNVYRHLLGVRTSDGMLCWTAILDADGKFYIGNSNEDDTPEHITAHEVFYGTGQTYTPVPITHVEGDVKITQTGHLLTIIDESDDFEHLVYKTSKNKYIKVKIDVSGERSDRTLYPFGQVHFNFAESGANVEHLDNLPEPVRAAGTLWYDDNYDPRQSVVEAEFNKDTMHDLMVKMFADATEDNRFTRPVLAVAAIKLYDGSYLYTSNPTLVFPNEVAYRAKRSFGYKIDEQHQHSYERVSPTMTTIDRQGNVIGEHVPAPDDYFAVPKCVNGVKDLGSYSVVTEDVIVGGGVEISGSELQSKENDVYQAFKMPTFSAGMHLSENLYPYVQGREHKICPTAQLKYYDLCCSLSGINELFKNNQEVFSSFCIFITPEADLYDMSDDPDTKGNIVYKYGVYSNDSYCVYCPVINSEEKIIYQLTHSNFYLLREYDAQEISELSADPTVKLTNPLYEGVLKNIVSRDLLTSESVTRTIYIPSVVYNYNNRLHFANYKSRQFHGYPLDLFQINNHSVKYEDGASFHGLNNISDNDDAYSQWARGCAPYERNSAMLADAAPMAFSIAEIETGDGIQKVVRYIAADETVWRENLDALLTFPDYRAKSITIYWYDATPPAAAGNYVFRYKKFNLKPHQYLNFAYYFDSNLKPISWENMTSLKGVEDIDAIFDLVEEVNVEENFPNGLKVSSTQNPMYFPVENTYQVGSAEILALCSNTIAVGTGQTGEAPLYVFCADGIYALFVDASGQMAYPNARAIARDVLNNPKSVTPIDAGVAFTTDRGLMLIAGEQVQEIGQPLEGDYFHISTSFAQITDNKDRYKKIIYNALTDSLLANIPATAFTGTDFLTFLKGSILNYNHNEWELMVSNPAYDYTYILDKNNAWSRRNYKALEYVNNYPSSFRVAPGNMFYQVDKQSDNDNSVFFMTRELKLDSIGFKSLQRVVIRGFFDTMPYTTTVNDTETTDYKYLGLYVFGSHDARQWACLGHRERKGTFTDIGCLVERTDCKFFCFVLAGQLKKESRLDYIEVSSRQSKLGTKIR